VAEVTAAHITEVNDLHRHIEGIKHELAQTKEVLTDRLHKLELAIAERPRMPAWGAVLIIFVAGQLGAFIYWGGQVTQQIGAVPELRALCEECQSKVAAIRETEAQVLSRLTEAETKLSGGTDDRWRKADDTRVMADMQRYIDVRFNEVDRRLQHQESRAAERDKWWQTVWGSGVMKGAKP